MVTSRKPAQALEHRSDPRPVEHAWDARTRMQSPLADATWIRCLADAFGETPEIVTQVRGSELVAGLALVPGSDGLARVWTSLDNEHNPYWLGAGAPADARAFLSYVFANVDYLYLRRLPVESPLCHALRDAAVTLGLDAAFVEM